MADLVALEDASCINAGQPIELRDAASVAHEAASHCKVAILANRWYRVPEHERGELRVQTDEKRISRNHGSANVQVSYRTKNCIKVAFRARSQYMTLHTQRAGASLQIRRMGFGECE